MMHVQTQIKFAVELSLGGSNPYISTEKNKNKYT